MSDPRITGITPRTTDGPAPLNKGEVALKILSATDGLKNIRRPTRIDGTVSAVSKDGQQATIATAKGDITVQLKNNTTLQQGQDVEIDLPAGQPPRQVVLRPDPAPPQSPSQPSPQPAATPPQDTEQAPQKDNPAQDATQDTTQDTASRPPARQPAPPLTPEQSPAQTALPVESQTAPRATLQTSTQNALPPESRAALDRAVPPAPQAVPAAPAPLPEGAIVRLLPLPGLPPDDQLLSLPLKTAVVSVLRSALNAGPLVEDQIKSLLTPVAPAEYRGKPPAQTPFPSQTNAIKTSFFVPDPGDSTAPFFFLKPVTGGPPGSFDVRLLTIRTASPPGAVAADIPVPGHSPSILPHMATQTQFHEAPPQGRSIPHAPGFLTADIIATTRTHLPVLALFLPGLKASLPFILQFPATNLPPGTQIDLFPQSLPVPVDGTDANAAAPATVPQGLFDGWTWPALDDAAQILSRAMPQAHMAQTMAALLPSPSRPAAMAAAITFFIAALQSGDLASWFGDKAISALRRDAARGGDILSRLTRDADTLSRTMDAPVTQNWRAVVLPMAWQNEIQKIHLFYRRQEEEKEDENGNRDPATRFLFDLNLTRMGDVQIDGLMKTKRLDVILRTATPLGHGMQTALRGKYLNVLEAGNLSGDLAFQNRLDQWVRVKVDSRQSALKTSI